MWKLVSTLAKKISEFATMTADANAKQWIIERQTRVPEAKPRCDANMDQLKRDQINVVTIPAAKAYFEAKRMEAEEIQILAVANAKPSGLTG